MALLFDISVRIQFPWDSILVTKDDQICLFEAVNCKRKPVFAAIHHRFLADKTRHHMFTRPTLMFPYVYLLTKLPRISPMLLPCPMFLLVKSLCFLAKSTISPCKIYMLCCLNHHISPVKPPFSRIPSKTTSFPSKTTIFAR